MDKREVCFLIGDGDTVLWADASTSAVALPDARARWEAIWQRREEIIEIAHTHPLGGARFSSEDESTMKALDAALGRRLRYSVVTPTQVLRRDEQGDERLVSDAAWWVGLIRLASGVDDDHDTGDAQDSTKE